jgi:penicillin amidase
MPHSPDESWTLQQDVHSVRATRLIALLGSTPRDPANEAQVLLLGWNGDIDAGSKAAALFEFWQVELQKEVMRVVIPPIVAAQVPFMNALAMLDLLEKPDKRFGEEQVRARDALLLRSLAVAAAQLKKRAKPGETFAAWGELHEVVLHHPLEARLPPEIAKQATASGHGTSGDGTTVMARWWGAPRTDATGGATFRAVLDVGNWEEARATMGPGQAGSPGDPHYRDLYSLWLDNKSFPLSFSAAAVARVAEQHIALRPLSP